MPQAYSDQTREADPYSLPDVEIFEMTAREVAERDEDTIYEYMRRHEFRLAAMNSRVRDQMFDCMIEEQSITGGWFYWFCFPGCLPDSDPVGPFESANEALKACREENDL